MLCNFNTVLDSMVVKDPRVPLSIKCELTYRCNFRCKHCYCRVPANGPSLSKELPLDEWERILEESAAEGALFLTFTGGEPLLRPDFKELWICAKEKGFLVSLFTNGSLLSPDWIDFFRKWSPNEVAVSIYGASPDSYEQVAGSASMFEVVMNNLEIMRAAELPLLTRSIITRRNIDEFAQLKELNLKFSKNFTWDAELFGATEGSQGKPFEERIAPGQVVALEAQDSQRVKELEKLYSRSFGKKYDTGKSYRCALGERGFAIDPYGNMRACQVLEPLKYNLRSGSVRDGWREVVPEQLSNLKPGDSKCTTCDLRIFCRICPAFALREGGGQEGPTEYHCTLGEERFKRYRYCLERN
ncbi:radical SAM protein [Desulfosediminicola ganghwensis]|uniref:radical SAM protein n=1 Tax=Desulfosediminicola ganghwensis TaxID=2569540 RepID=UPI0010AC2CC2|nr:radical SAM protein [Desulfosediminicola ganghwensis]